MRKKSYIIPILVGLLLFFFFSYMFINITEQTKLSINSDDQLSGLFLFEIIPSRITQLEASNTPNIGKFNLNSASLHVIAINDCQLIDIPKFITKNKDLISFRMESNNISKITAKQLFNLDKLKLLNLSFNPLTDIPQEIINHRSLETLFWNGTKITSLPAIMPNSSLRNLQVAYSPIEKMPYIPPNTIKVLNISNTKVSDFTFLKDSDLESLSCNNLRINSIPNEIATMDGLKQLFIRNNNITVLPTLCNSIELLALEGNPLIDISSLATINNLKNLSLPKSMAGNYILNSIVANNKDIVIVLE